MTGCLHLSLAWGSFAVLVAHNCVLLACICTSCHAQMYWPYCWTIPWTHPRVIAADAWACETARFKCAPGRL